MMTFSMETLEIRLRDLDQALVEEWEKAFVGCEQVEVSTGDIFAYQADAIVSPANSFGYMDGGIDLIYSQFFGWDLEKRLRKVLLEEHDGELPVGQAVILPTEHEWIPYLISAPTMRVPMAIPKTAHAYLAFRAVLQAIRRFNQQAQAPIKSVLCPGLATGVGMMPAKRCAKQMRYAYEVIVKGELLTIGGLAGACRNHIDLVDYHQEN